MTDEELGAPDGEDGAAAKKPKKKKKKHKKDKRHEQHLETIDENTNGQGGDTIMRSPSKLHHLLVLFVVETLLQRSEMKSCL